MPGKVRSWLAKFLRISTSTCLISASFNVNSAKTANWVVRALVEATPISGPAWLYTPASVSLEMELPTTLTTPKRLAPFLSGHPYRGIVSTGYAGGLREKCKLGDILVPDEVQSVPPLPEVSLRPDPALREEVLERIRKGPWQVHTGRMVTTDHVVVSSAEKQALGLKYEADSVEMESTVIAELAEQASVPFVVVRVVLDEASFSLPDILQVFRWYRKKQFGKLIPHVALHPYKLVELLRLLLRSRKATQALNHLFLAHLLDGLAELGRSPGKDSAVGGLKT